MAGAEKNMSKKGLQDLLTIVRMHYCVNNKDAYKEECTNVSNSNHIDCTFWKKGMMSEFPTF